MELHARLVCLCHRKRDSNRRIKQRKKIKAHNDARLHIRAISNAQL